MKKISYLLSLVGLQVFVLLGHPDPALAQTATFQVTPNPVVFNVAPGGSAFTALTISSNPAGIAFTLQPSTDNNLIWLFVSPNMGTTPMTSAVVTVNAGSLPVGTYGGHLTIMSQGLATPITTTVPVSLTVGGTLSVSPTALTFNYQVGAATPAAQAVTLTAGSSQVTFAATISSSPSGWLQVSQATGTILAGQSLSVNIGVNPTSLAAQSQPYTGTVTFTPQGAATPVTVSVTLNVSSNPQLQVLPTSMTFNYQVGAAPPPAQTLSVSSTGSLINFSATATSSACGSTPNWLVVSPASGAASTNPALLQVSVIVPQGVTNSQCVGQIQITSSGATNPTVTVGVTFNISSSPFLNASPNSLSYTYQVGGALPASQPITVSSTGTALNYSVSTQVSSPSGGGWLSVTPLNGNTSAQPTLTVTVSPQSLSGGTYSGTVTITPQGAANSSITVQVTLTVSSNALLTVSPTVLSFAYETTGFQPNSQTVTITSTGAPLGYTAAAQATSPTQWLVLSGATTGNTPGSLVVSVTPSGLQPGSYSGTINVTVNGSTAPPVTITVNLVISNSALFAPSASSLTFTAPAGSTSSQSANLAITSTDFATQIAFSVSATTTSGGSWLGLTANMGTTPSTLTVVAVPSGLPPGQYSGAITVTASTGSVANSPLSVPVTLIITPNASLAASPASLSFTQVTGGAPPPTQAVSVTSSGGALNFNATATTAIGTSWLAVTPASGTTNSTLTVSANGASLSPGTYTGTITITSPGAANSLTVQVALTVQQVQTASVTPLSLTFNYQIGGTVPGSQTLTLVTSSGSAAFTATAATTASTNWLSVSPASGTSTPATLTASVSPGALSVGTYTGTLSIAVTGASNSPLIVQVTLIVSPPAFTPTIGAVVNAASNLPTSVSPGLIVTIYGTSIGPAPPGVGLQLTAQGTVSTSIGNTQVFFDGIPAPLAYVSSTQINVIVPYEIAGRFSTAMQVVYLGVQSTPVQLRVIDSAPGIFTLAQTGSGQGAILNQNGTVNGPTNPAPKNSVIVIYGTGEGQTSPGGVTGSVTSPALLKRPILPVTVTVNGVPAKVDYAGAAPGLVAGVIQVNAELPNGTPSGNVPVVITVGSGSSQQNVTVAVQ